MKTSNQLLIAVVILIVCYVALQNLSLKAAYLKGEYRSPYYQMEKLNIAGFNAINFNPRAFATLQISKGANFEVWVDQNEKNRLLLTKTGRTLNIGYPIGDQEWSNYKIYINCPELKSFIAKSKVKDVDYADVAFVEIHGFDQDSMRVQTAKAITVHIMSGTINKLNAGSDSTGGKLAVYPYVHIKQSNFNMQGMAELTLYDSARAEKRNFKFSPTASLILSNDALKLFQHGK